MTSDAPAPLDELLRQREAHLGKALSIAHGKPLHITHGCMQYLTLQTAPNTSTS